MADLTALDTSYMSSTCRILRQDCEQVAGRTVCGDEETVATVACQGVGTKMKRSPITAVARISVG